MNRWGYDIYVWVNGRLTKSYEGRFLDEAHARKNAALILDDNQTVTPPWWAFWRDRIEVIGGPYQHGRNAGKVMQ